LVAPAELGQVFDGTAEESVALGGSQPFELQGQGGSGSGGVAGLVEELDGQVAGVEVHCGYPPATDVSDLYDGG